MSKARKTQGGVKSQSQAFARARAFITKQGSIVRGVGRYKARSSSDEIRRVMPEFLKSKIYHSLIWPDIRPKSYNSLGKGGVWGYGSLETELAWQLQSLLPYCHDINQFVTIRSEFNNAFLLGNYDACDNILDELDVKFGKSLWGTEASINLIQARDGFAEQKSFTNRVLSHKGLNPIWHYLITWFTFRAERNVSATELARHVHKAAPLNTAFSHLVHLSVGLCPAVSAETARATLSYLSHLPLVDRYSFSIMICQALLSSDCSAPIKHRLGHEFEPLATRIRDHALTKLMLVCANPIRPHDTPTLTHELEAHDAYSAGNYERAVSIAWEGLCVKPSIDALQIGLRADAAGNLNSALPTFPAGSNMAVITADLRRVISYSDDADEAVRRLDKASMTWPHAAWASSLRLILLRQRRDERVTIAGREQIFHALKAEDESPILAATLYPLRITQQYLDVFFPSTESTSIATILSVIEDRAPPFSAAYNASRIDTLRALRAGRFEEATTLLQMALATPRTRHAQLELGRQLVAARLQIGDLMGAAETAAGLILISRYAATLLPIQELVEALVQADLSGASRPLAPLSVSIVFDFYSRNISSDRDSERADAFNDFLAANGLVYASDLDASKNDFPPEQIIYFLRYVCVPEVLDQSLNLASTREVEDERAKVIVKASDLLAQTGMITPSELLEEVQDIKLKQVVRDTTLQLDQSKVYVNVDGIRKAVDAQVREGWHRFRLFKLHESSVSSIDEISKKIQELMGERYKLVMTSAPSTEKYRMFYKMMKDIFDQFTGSREFGLDANLSTNIRHGFITRALRGPFVTRKLITNKATSSGEYQNNIYWLQRAQLGEEGEALLNQSLANFSAEIDEEIESLTRRFLRIRGEAAQDGLFDFHLYDIEAQLLMQRWEEEVSHEIFIEKVFEYLWALTEASLDQVRNHLVHKTLSTMQNSLTQLASSVEEILPAASVSALGAAINLVRPDLQSAIEKVASWFTLSLTQDYQNYPAKIAFDTGLATVKSYYSQLNIVTEFDSLDNITMAGWTLPHVTRLFTILFENAAFHSGITQGDLLIKGGVISDAATLKLSLSNTLSPEKDMQQLETTVQKLNADFGRDAAQEFIRLEGGSGYPKMWKILRHDLRRDHALEVNITSASEFLVEIVMDAQGMLA